MNCSSEKRSICSLLIMIWFHFWCTKIIYQIVLRLHTEILSGSQDHQAIWQTVTFCAKVLKRMVNGDYCQTMPSSVQFTLVISCAPKFNGQSSPSGLERTLHKERRPEKSEKSEPWQLLSPLPISPTSCLIVLKATSISLISISKPMIRLALRRLLIFWIPIIWLLKSWKNISLIFRSHRVAILSLGSPLKQKHFLQKRIMPSINLLSKLPNPKRTLEAETPKEDSNASTRKQMMQKWAMEKIIMMTLLR